MQDEQAPKLDKALLGKIVMHAKHVYIDRGNYDGSRYLEPMEMIARAYCEAFLSVLKSQGYVVVRKPVE